MKMVGCFYDLFYLVRDFVILILEIVQLTAQNVLGKLC